MKSAIAHSVSHPRPQPVVFGDFGRRLVARGRRVRLRLAAPPRTATISAPGNRAEHRLHQRIGAHACLQLGLLARRPAPARVGGAGLARDHDHPAPAGPFRKLARQIVDQRLARHSARARSRAGRPRSAPAARRARARLHLDVALLAGERDELLEGRDRERRRVGRPRRAALAYSGALRGAAARRRERGARGAERGASTRGARRRRARRRRHCRGRAGRRRRRSRSARIASSGVGRSAAWAMRTSTISAARDRPAGRLHLGDALEQHLPGARQHAHRQRRGERACRACARPRPARHRRRPPARSFSRVTKCVNSARSVSTTAGSAPASYCVAELGERRRRRRPHQLLEQVDDAGAVGEAEHAAAPSSARTGAGAMGDRLVEDRQRSRAPSLRRRARSWPAPRLDLDAFLGGDACEMLRPAAPASMRRRSKRWQRDSTVIGTLRISVVAKMNFTCGGGSSSVFSRRVEGLRRRACALRR